ncbi:MAG: undecaprenyl-phosphate glucose phosphotransferase [Lachnospiraceae bacterium]|jgi:Undecaprenyl-phosphate glucose phosphotransferase|nr:undecaprenyl-phosphate glucose phosphotransferase [Lachnospiraceae bacterium]MBQ5376694.1 undecaprenyl-phosphate glucose phosphotransferase [Lachnospiraceae bacterium]MBR1849604.1 undecaprenyl-phosphate glucose phosphotransferase [Lachnospiraceae bacterium]
MIKDNQKYFNGLHVVIDGALVAISYITAWWLKFESPFSNVKEGEYHLDMQTYFRAIPFLVVGYLILYSLCKLYTPKRGTDPAGEIAHIIEANTLGIVITTSVLFVIWQQHFSRSMIFLFFVVNTLLTTLFRGLVRYVLKVMRRSGHNMKHVLLVGYSRATEQYIDRIKMNPQWGYVVHAILDDEVPRGSLYKGVKVVGTIGNLEYILPENKLDEIAIALPLKQYDRLGSIVSLCEKSGVHTKFIPDYSEVFSSRPYTEDLMGLPVINIRNVPLTNTLNRILKRTVDFLGSFVGIILISPLLLILAVAVKLSSPGPIIFKQQRIGLHNKPFQMYKFRSMRMQSPEDEKKGWTTKGDPRVTKVGAFIRRTSLDELPQLFNVLKGDMSLVGPRPERPQYVDKFKEEIPRYMVKHQVRPGMTGWAQVNGYRGDTSIKKRIEYDIYYIENWTLGFDIRILFRTIFHGFVNKNAY